MKQIYQRLYTVNEKWQLPLIICGAVVIALVVTYGIFAMAVYTSEIVYK